jgi:hypothetical protein
VFPFHLDVALNLLWVAISLIALVEFARLEGKAGPCGTPGRFHRLLAVCMMAIFIFPSISDSDDLFRFSLLQPPSQTGGFGNAPQDERQEKSNLQLQRLLEDLEHFQVGAFCLIAFTLCFLAFALTPRIYSLWRAAECYAGRAPPLLPARS